LIDMTNFEIFQWKGVPEFQILKSKEAHLDGSNIEPQSLKQQVGEAELQDNLTPSPGIGKPGMFKQFDIVDDYSDHHFVSNTVNGVTSQVKGLPFSSLSNWSRFQ